MDRTRQALIAALAGARSMTGGQIAERTDRILRTPTPAGIDRATRVVDVLLALPSGKETQRLTPNELDGYLQLRAELLEQVRTQLRRAPLSPAAAAGTRHLGRLQPVVAARRVG